MRFTSIRDNSTFEEAFGIRREFVHPLYQSVRFYNDIAVLELSKCTDVHNVIDRPHSINI